jgi:ribosomal protein S27AE
MVIYGYKSKPKRCPACGSEKILSIVYGYPGDELSRDAQAGKVILGGCCVTGDDPIWQCGSCNMPLFKTE